MEEEVNEALEDLFADAIYSADEDNRFDKISANLKEIKGGENLPEEIGANALEITKMVITNTTIGDNDREGEITVNTDNTKINFTNMEDIEYDREAQTFLNFNVENLKVNHLNINGTLSVGIWGDARNNKDCEIDNITFTPTTH